MTRAMAFRARSAASFRRPLWIASPRRVCATRSFIPPHSVRPRALRLSPGATIIPLARVLSASWPPAIRATIPSSGWSALTIGEILKENGYATSWFGKEHNTPSFQYSIAGPYDQWPSGMGFEYFYGFMGGETDQWTPYLFKYHTQIFPWSGRKHYNLTTDIADE